MEQELAEARSEPRNADGLFEASGGESILVVDDDPFIARLLEIELRAAGYDVRVANDGERGLELARERSPELVLADVMMPNMDGFELTRHLRMDSRTASVSVIMLTARGLSADKLEGFAVGADDYIVKPFDTPELLARIRGALRRSREMRAQSPLTGLPGNVRIADEIEQRCASQKAFAVLYADLDHFKAYNDHYGFMRGDEVIQATARLLQDVTMDVAGEGAFVGHVGGDDFVIVCDATIAALLAERAIERFDALIGHLYDDAERERGGIEVISRRGETHLFPVITISIGVATTERRTYANYAEAVAVASEMKSYAKKAHEGSSWAVDRRTS
ncbi:MAG TPA: response regulator [Actinomycetota bacterium]|nr:response regulator [Actinomycetota bacterium]